MDKIPAYILAGGKSSRFGSDKALAMFEGRPLIQRIAETIGPVVSRVTVIAEQNDKYAQLGLRTIADLQTDLGPLGGLHTALHDCGDDVWLLLLSCDLLTINPAWLGVLLERREEGTLAVAFRPDVWQPLCAIYHRSVQGVVGRRLASGDRSMQSLLAELRAVEAPLPADWPALLQVNDPQDLRRASSQVPLPPARKRPMGS